MNDDESPDKYSRYRLNKEIVLPTTANSEVVGLFLGDWLAFSIRQTKNICAGNPVIRESARSSKSKPTREFDLHSSLKWFLTNLKNMSS